MAEDVQLAHSPSFLARCCRVCGRAVDERSRRALFSAAGKRDKLQERMASLTGLLIRSEAGLSDFVCRNCVSEMTRYEKKMAEAHELKRLLTQKHSRTAVRQIQTVQWSRSPRTPSTLLHKRSKPAWSPRTPQSAQKSRPKYPRLSPSARAMRVLFSPPSQENVDPEEDLCQKLPSDPSSGSESFPEDVPGGSKENVRVEATSKPEVSVKVVIGYQKPFTVTLDGTVGEMTKNLARGRLPAFSKAAMKHPKIAELMIKAVCRAICRECSSIVGTNEPSMLRKKSKSDLVRFEWETLAAELKQRAPVLLTVLGAVADKAWSWKTVALPSSCVVYVCMALAVLMKSRNKHLTAVQTGVSLLLNAGHVSSQTYTRLNKLGVCLSHSQTLRVVDKFSGGHDAVVRRWIQQVVHTDAIHGVKHDHTYTMEMEPPVEATAASTSDSGRSESNSSSVTSPLETPPLQPEDPDLSVVLMELGWKYVGDNLDLTIKVRDMRQDNPNDSYHFFHTIAVQDRIDASHLDSTMPKQLVSTLDVSDFLPSSADYHRLREDFIILVSRVLTSELEEFKFLASSVPSHISHEFSDQMSCKSSVVPLGVTLKNENISAEMVEIMESLHQYVPSRVSGQETGEVLESCLFGGDQLTCSRARSAKRHRQDSETAVERLDGLEPVIEDWHTKMCLYEIIFHRYYNAHSITDHGTLWQLRCLIRRHNVSTNVSKEMNALDDFFKSVGKAHILAAALSFFDMDSTTEQPKRHAWPPELKPAASQELNWEYLHDIVGAFVDDYVMPCVSFSLSGKPHNSREEDGIRNYACSLLSDCLLVKEFNDTVHEGDGERMMVIWKLLLLYFRATGHRNYALEAVLLVAQTQALLSERDAFRVKWCRFVNTRGHAGANISCDLAMEHWNKAFKTHLSATGANINASTILRTGTALSTLESICNAFDKASKVTPPTVKHATKSSKKDERTMLELLHKQNVFEASGSHSKFIAFPRNHLHRIDREKFKKWINGHIKTLATRQNKQLQLRRRTHQNPLPLNPVEATRSLISELEDDWDEDDSQYM